MTSGVSAVVVSFHTGPVLDRCLDALLGDLGIREVIVVDNGNPPDVVEGLAARAASSHGRLTVVGGGINRGFASACNLGAAAAAGDRLLFINPDAVLQPGSLAALEAARVGRRAPTLVGGHITDAEGREQRGGRRGRLDLLSGAGTFLGLSGLRLHPRLSSIDRSREPPPDAPILTPVVSGALMYLSRSDFEALGGFDEGYFLHVEDIDICRRVELAGGDVVYTPLASAMHEGATSAASRLFVERCKARGLNRYFVKFATRPVERVAAHLLGPVIGAALILRALIRR
ncbi:glycosyltransferase [bacterium]|nr:glycosyltransferase [bacterium]